MRHVVLSRLPLHPTHRASTLLRPLSFGHTAYRLQSSQASAPAFIPPKPKSQHYASESGLFAVEHVDGRARHLSWSDSGSITKEWRERSGKTAPGENAGATTKSSPFGKLTAWLRQMFLPTNYPQSVHRSYLPYHILQFSEGIIGTLVSVLCNQALLVSVGMSAEGSILGAVAVQWVIKDGAGEIAKLFFIRKFSPYFDSHPKTLNLIAAGSVLLGSALQLVALVIPATLVNFLMCAAGGNIFKMVGGAIWLTCHIKFVRLFARQGNMGDVAAKAESQGSVSQLLGYGVGIGLLTVSTASPYLFSIFAVAVPAHMALTALMLRVATFELLTIPRLSFLARDYASSAGRPEAERRLPSLRDLEQRENTGFYGEFFKTKEDKYAELAPLLEDIVKSSDPRVRALWDVCVDAFDNHPYLLFPYLDATNRWQIAIFYNPSTKVDDIIQSVLHAAYLEHHLSKLVEFAPYKESPHYLIENQEALAALLEKSNKWTTLYYHEFKALLQERSWRTDELAFADMGRRVLWGSAAAQSEPVPAPADAPAAAQATPVDKV